MIRTWALCEDCGGRRVISRKRYIDDPNTFEIVACPTCGGHGQVLVCEPEPLELDPPAPPRADSPPDPRPRETITDVFTFGFDCAHPATGAPLKGMYVEITAQDHEAARDGMIARFGLRWAFQYPSREAAGVWRHGLRLLEEITV